MALGGSIVGMARVVLRADRGGLQRDLAGAERDFDQATGRMAARGGAQAATLAKTLQVTGRTMQGYGRDLNRHVTLPLLAVGAASFKMADDLDKSLDKIVGLVGVSRQQVNAWQKDLLRLGPALGKSPAELADALFFVTSAGLRGEKALDALTESAKASTAGLGETKVVADAVTSAMNAYADVNLTAAQATDTLVATVREGKVEAAALAPVLGRVLPIAAELGVGFNEVGAAIAAMTRTGTSADTAATQLRATLASMVKVTPQAAKALESVGLSGEELRRLLQEKGLLSVLQLLQERFHGNITEIAHVFPNIRALTAELQLTGKAAGETAGVFERMSDTTGSAAAAFKAATDDDFFKAKQALIELQVAAIKFGAAIAPAVATVAHLVGGLANVFTRLPKPVQDTLVKVGLLAALAGPVLTLSGALLRLAGALVGVQTAAAGAAGARGVGGLSGALARMPKSVRVSLIVAIGATFAYPWLKKAFEEGFGADFSAPQAPGDLIPVFRGGKWVDPNTGTPVPDQAYWNQRWRGAHPGVKPPPEVSGRGTFPQTTTGAPAATGTAGPAVAATARQFGPGSGITYTWGGETPQEGFDCSGIIYFAYGRAGVKIPRTSQAQFFDPNAIVVPSGQEQPGDGVYFAGEGAGGGSPPGHAGIYIGGGKFIEYFSKGKPAKISVLAARSDYMGARRWLKIGKQTGGDTTTPKDTPATAKATLQEQLVRAQIKGDTGGQLAAIRGLEQIAQADIDKAKAGSKERLAALQELQRLKEQEQNLLDGKGGAGSPLIPPRLSEAVETARLKDDPVALISALEAQQTALEQALKTAKRGSERRVQILQALQQVKADLAGARQELVQRGFHAVDLAQAKAALTPGLRDDLAALEAQDALINAQLRKRNLSMRDRATLLREQAGVRTQIKEIRDKLPLSAKELAAVDLKPADLKDIPGIAALLTRVGRLQQGTSGRTESTEVPGIGKILTPAKPRLEDWKKVLVKLRQKLKAAQVKKQKVWSALQRALAMPAKLRNSPTVKTAIGRMRQTLALLDRDIADIRTAVAQVSAGIKDLYDAATAKEVQDAQEAEQVSAAAEQAHDEAVGSALSSAADLPADTRLAISQAQGTAGAGDDLAALEQAAAGLEATLTAGTVTIPGSPGSRGGGSRGEPRAAEVVPLDTETRIAITDQLNQVRSQIQSIRDDQAQQEAAAAREREQAAADAAQQHEQAAAEAARARADAAQQQEQAAAEAARARDQAAADAAQQQEQAAADHVREIQAALADADKLSAEVRLALALAEATKPKEDDLAALRDAEKQLQSRLDAATVTTASGGQVPIDVEARIALINQLTQIRSNIETVTQAIQDGADQVSDAVKSTFDATAQIAAFLAASRNLREFDSTVVRGALRGSTIQIVNQFPASPDDPHAWAKSLEFELNVIS